MPDADDFDVEYFRSLMKGNSPKEAAPPATPAAPATKKTRKPPGKAAVAGAEGEPKARQKKGNKD